MATYGGLEMDDMINTLPPAIGKKLIEAFAKIGVPLLEEAYVEGDSVPGSTNMEEIDTKIAAMFKDDHPLMDLTHSDHQRALGEYQKLNRDKALLQGVS
jgi:hypothetical protein